MLQHALSSISRVITRQAVQVGPLASAAALPAAAASPASSLGLPLPVVSPALLPAYKGAFDRALGDFLEADDDDVPSGELGCPSVPQATRELLCTTRAPWHACALLPLQPWEILTSA
jgi:hypothetical protein